MSPFGSWMAVLLCIHLSLPLAVAQLEITDLFEVSFDPGENGNCATPGKNTLNYIVKDAYALSKIGQQAVQDGENAGATSHAEAMRLIEAFFHDPDEDDRTTIESFYSKVQQYLENGPSHGYGNDDQQIQKPYLFCDSQWLIRQSMDDQLLDENGQPVTYEDAAKTPFLIRDSPVFVQAQRDITRALGQEAYPYYSEQLHEYTFDKLFTRGDANGLPPPSFGRCQGEPDSGATYPFGPVSVVVLCPDTFTDVPLRGVKAHPIDVATFIDGEPPDSNYQVVSDVFPEAITLFHELFHLVLGYVESVPQSGGEVYNAFSILSASTGPTGENALMNPETFAVVAVAYDYTVNAPEVNDRFVEYYTGWCTTQAGDNEGAEPDGDS